jgi:hypothetical protein
VVEKETRLEALKYLRGRVLSLGYPDGLSDADLKDCELVVVDAVRHRGTETLADLNEPQKFGEFDFVIDPGTVEHCANVGLAMASAVRAVKVGGHIIHTAPVSMVNHGYFNFSPSFFPDFYRANGLELVRCDLFDLEHKPVRVENLHGRCHFPPETWALVVGRRVAKSPATFPVQGIWKK